MGTMHCTEMISDSGSALTNTEGAGRNCFVMIMFQWSDIGIFMVYKNNTTTT